MVRRAHTDTQQQHQASEHITLQDKHDSKQQAVTRPIMLTPNETTTDSGQGYLASHPNPAILAVYLGAWR